MLTDNARHWQDTFDRDFPHGLVARFEAPVSTRVIHVPRVEVAGMRGLDPVVVLAAAAYENFILGQVSSYDVLQHEPHLLARVTLADHGGKTMLWSAGLTQYERDQLAAARRESLQESERGLIFDQSRM